MSRVEPTQEERRVEAVVSPVNAAAAEWLDRLADELSSEEPALSRRIAAYRAAARGLRRSPHRVEDLWHGGGSGALTRIDHVTPAIAQLICDLIASRRIRLPPRTG